MGYYRGEILVCGGTGCVSSGCLDVSRELENQLQIYQLDKEIKVIETGCHVFCEMGPLVVVYPEACGKCIPCREGTKRMLEILEKIIKGQGQADDIETLERLSKNIKGTSLCGLGQTAPNPVLSTIRYFKKELEAHIIDKRCPAGVCSDLILYRILPELYS